MMDMKAPVSLPSVSASKVEAPKKVDDVNHAETSDFDRHLSQQMEKAEPEKASADPAKTEENQSLGDDLKQQSDADGEVDLMPVVEGGQVVEEVFLLNTVEAVSEVEAPELVIEELDEPVLTVAEDEQTVPLAGNALPPGILNENAVNKDFKVPVEAIISKEPGIKVSNNDVKAQVQAQAPVNLHKQPALAEVLAESSEEKPVTAEFKVETKTTKEAGNQLAQTRAGLNIATLAVNASAQQYVPQPTASAAINMQSATAAVESFTASPTMSGSIGAAVQSPAWSQGLTERVTWMLQGNVQSAELKLNPAHLGPMEIKLSVQDDKASISFVTGHAQVKEAIDTAMPRLREMLEQQGLDLADVDVSQYSDAKDDQAEDSDQNDITGDMAQSDSERAVSMHESVINMDVDQGLSVFA